MDTTEYAKGHLLENCYEVIPGLSTAYGYVPSLPAGIVFAIIFFLFECYHAFRSVTLRKWTSHMLTIGSVIECLGWTARTWSSKCPYNRTAFLLQITTLVLAPLFIAAAIYVTLGYLISQTGPQYSLIRPRLYLWIFCIADAAALLIQAGGGGIAAKAANEGRDTKPGSNMMVGGIIFQLASMTVFALLFGIFIWRTRHAGLVRNQRLVIYAMGVSVTAVYVRSVYRTVELLEGWDGHLLRTEGYFLGLDAACMVIAIGVFTVLDPAVLLLAKEDNTRLGAPTLGVLRDHEK